MEKTPKEAEQPLMGNALKAKARCDRIKLKIGLQETARFIPLAGERYSE